MSFAKALEFFLYIFIASLVAFRKQVKIPLKAVEKSWKIHFSPYLKPFSQNRLKQFSKIAYREIRCIALRSVNHFSKGEINASHNVTCSPRLAENDSRLLKKGGGNSDGEWIFFCRRKEADVALFSSDKNEKDHKKAFSRVDQLVKMLDNRQYNNLRWKPEHPWHFTFYRFWESLRYFGMEFYWKTLRYYNFGDSLITWVKLFYDEISSCI